MGDHHTLQNFGYNIRFDLPKWVTKIERKSRTFYVRNQTLQNKIVDQGAFLFHSLSGVTAQHVT